jgi:hypothetical protein
MPRPLPGVCKVCAASIKPTQRYCDACRPSKYKSRKTAICGQTFDSAAEGERYLELRMLEEAHQIEGWDWKQQKVVPLRDARQQRIPLIVNGIKVCTYVADFVYRDLFTGKLVIEDLKGYKTDVYRLKAKLFAACLGFPITEIKRVKKRRVG